VIRSKTPCWRQKEGEPSIVPERLDGVQAGGLNRGINPGSQADDARAKVEVAPRINTAAIAKMSGRKCRDFNIMNGGCLL
jgi:hypothetical protein